MLTKSRHISTNKKLHTHSNISRLHIPGCKFLIQVPSRRLEKFRKRNPKVCNVIFVTSCLVPQMIYFNHNTEKFLQYTERYANKISFVVCIWWRHTPYGGRPEDRALNAYYLLNSALNCLDKLSPFQNLCYYI